MTYNIYPLVARAILPLLVLSLVSNLAILISPLFMMQVLDRVIPSGNIATLALLGVLALAALVVQALVEASRDLALGRLARWSEQEGTALALAPNAAEPNQTIRQVAGLSQFLGGPAAIAALGAPWIPIFALVIWMLHPAFLLLVLAMSGIFLMSRAFSNAFGRVAQDNVKGLMALEQATLREANDTARDVGIATLVQNLRLRFSEVQHKRLEQVDQGELPRLLHSTVSSLVRNAGQISALALGAWLVTADQLSAGGMIAGSIITSKTYAAIESFLVSFPVIREAKREYATLAALPIGQEGARPVVDEPSGDLRVDNLIFPRGGGAPPRLDRVSFDLHAGECLAVVGSSGSGKSTLLRALFGSDPAPIGSVFLGDTEIKSLPDTELCLLSGFVPQCAVLRTGTIADNIGSFTKEIDPNALFDAAKTAGVHGLISALPNSYETDIGKEPHLLSMGQMQRIALARAIYLGPKYLFLDEPNALLDADGERALGQALMRLKKQGTTIVMAVHRSGILGLADKVMKVDHGRIVDFGQKSEVLGRLGLDGRQIELPTLQTSSSDLTDWVMSQFTRDGDLGFSHRARFIAGELLNIASGNCPRDTLRFANFAFKFLDRETCEITMREPAEGDVEERLERVRSKLQTTQSNLVHLAQDELRFARLSNMSRTFEVSTDKETTTYRAIVSAVEEARSPDHEDQAV